MQPGATARRCGGNGQRAGIVIVVFTSLGAAVQGTIKWYVPIIVGLFAVLTICCIYKYRSIYSSTLNLIASLPAIGKIIAKILILISAVILFCGIIFGAFIIISKLILANRSEIVSKLYPYLLIFAYYIILITIEYTTKIRVSFENMGFEFIKLSLFISLLLSFQPTERLMKVFKEYNLPTAQVRQITLIILILNLIFLFLVKIIERKSFHNRNVLQKSFLFGLNSFIGLLFLFGTINLYLHS